jgi:hypothetical protein
MEEKIQEKKLLSAEEIEAQALLELPDRQLMQAEIGDVNQVFQFIITSIKLAFGD